MLKKAMYHVMRKQCTLDAPRLWAEEGVGRAKLNKHEKPSVLGLKERGANSRILARHRLGGGCRQD